MLLILGSVLVEACAYLMTCLTYCISEYSHESVGLCRCHAASQSQLFSRHCSKGTVRAGLSDWEELNSPGTGHSLRIASYTSNKSTIFRFINREKIYLKVQGLEWRMEGIQMVKKVESVRKRLNVRCSLMFEGDNKCLG